ncbi:branched-chain amino acid transport system ATP-binding protein [Lipingzhangella halophila]|uniref:Branched-chain amino acid transport system ATP-binding protein n=1 Tax=Lipingzhangella halophila TaxID=1783352 RepID=A0A7W7W3G4_9ACTN|nr:ABC transporter ATP-binding protein [Lipingzhangella halophila]MBB4933027.1 branched-chain amino acid transport system ATP-binding protein [Lipingzhangella halophila]
MTPSPTDHLLTADGVTVRFGGLVALKDVHITVPPGSVVGLIGPNGAGKTTLFNVLSGLITPNTGTISSKGHRLNGLRPHHLARHGISRTLQGLNLFSGMTVLDNVMTGAERLAKTGLFTMLTGLGRFERDERALRERAMVVLDELGITHVAGAYPGTLAYGVQKRVALARALVSEPDLLMLDEPASGLSSDELAELATRIRGLREHVSILLIEHHMDLVMDVCDHIEVLNFGAVISSGPPDTVRNDPAVTDAYLGSAEESDDE